MIEADKVKFKMDFVSGRWLHSYTSHVVKSLPRYGYGLLSCNSMRNVQVSMFFNWIKKKYGEIKRCSSLWLENFEGFYERRVCEFYKLFFGRLVLVVEVWRWCCSASKCTVKWEWKKTAESIINPPYFANVVRHKKGWWVSMPFTSHTQNRTWYTNKTNQELNSIQIFFDKNKDLVHLCPMEEYYSRSKSEMWSSLVFAL